jgi:hypothetical protein
MGSTGVGAAVAAAPVATVLLFAVLRARRARRVEAAGWALEKVALEGRLAFVPWASIERRLETLRKSDPTSALDQVVAVDCIAAGLRHVTHHRSASKAKGLRGDTSTELVVDALRTGHSAVLGAEVVTCDHFDVDGLCSVLALLLHDSPRAQAAPGGWPRVARLLCAAARIGDFRELDYAAVLRGEACETQALQLCCLLNTLERREFFRPFGGSGEDGKYELMLRSDAVLALVLEGAAERSRCDWGEEFEQVLTGCRALARPGAVRRHPQLGLLVIETVQPLHYYALFSHAAGPEPCDTVLTLYGGGRCEVEQRYTGFVELTSRPVQPRACLTKLAKVLSLASGGRERWGADRFVDSGPLLRVLPDAPDAPTLTKAQRYGHPFERPIAPSCIDAARIEHIVCGFLRVAHSSDQPLLQEPWSWTKLHEFNRRVNWRAIAEQLGLPAHAASSAAQGSGQKVELVDNRGS